MYTLNFKNVEIKMSDGSMIKGTVNISETQRRLSDFLRYSQEQFITVVSEESSEESKKVFFVNKQHIVWASPGTNRV